jgi:hypothetical protein
LGSNVESARAMRAKHPAGWRAADVVCWLLSKVPAATPALVGVEA